MLSNSSIQPQHDAYATFQITSNLTHISFAVFCPVSILVQAWGKDQGIEGSFVTFLADPAAELTKALGMEMTDSGPPSVGIIGRCKRFAIHADDEEIKAIEVSEGPDDPAGDNDPSKTLADNMLKVVTRSA